MRRLPLTALCRRLQSFPERRAFSVCHLSKTQRTCYVNSFQVFFSQASLVHLLALCHLLSGCLNVTGQAYLRIEQKRGREQPLFLGTFPSQKEGEFRDGFQKNSPAAHSRPQEEEAGHSHSRQPDRHRGQRDAACCECGRSAFRD